MLGMMEVTLNSESFSENKEVFRPTQAFKIRENIETAYACGSSLVRIANDILVHAKMRAVGDSGGSLYQKKLDLVNASFSLSELVRSTVDSMLFAVFMFSL